MNKSVTMLAVIFLIGKLLTGRGNQPLHRPYKEITARETH